ncbi:MAG: hypothetical protein ABIX37_03805, partial [Gammaproteobacteria bacterium]
MTYILVTLAALTVAFLVAAWWKSGGTPTALRAPPGVALGTVADLPGVRCERRVIPVKLAANGLLRYHVVGELCALDTPQGKTLQVLLSGS